MNDRMISTRTIVQHRCLRCRRLYRPDGGEQIYCGRPCYWADKRVVPETKLCGRRGCGRRFKVGGRGNAPRSQLFHHRRCASIVREQSRLRLRRSLARLMTVSERRWLACLIDGEGHLPRRGLSIFAEVGNTSLKYLLEAWRITGVGSIRKDPPTPGELPFWRWRVCRVDSVALLRQIVPYLKVKPRDAMRLIALYERAVDMKGGAQSRAGGRAVAKTKGGSGRASRPTGLEPGAARRAARPSRRR